ncbi:hypothetical protein Tco_1562685 [Tanacetum coccineum]
MLRLAFPPWRGVTEVSRGIEEYWCYNGRKDGREGKRSRDQAGSGRGGQGSGRGSQRGGRGGQGSGRGSQGGGRDGQESDQGSQGSSRGNEANGGGGGVPDFATIIAQQLQNLLPTIIAQGNVRTVNMNNGRGGCSYKEFMACNPKDYDGKGGAIVYTRWIEKMESVQDMSGCGENQKVKYTAGSFIAGHATYTDRFHELARLVPHLVTPENKRIEMNEALKKNAKKRGNNGEPSKDGNVRDSTRGLGLEGRLPQSQTMLGRSTLVSIMRKMKLGRLAISLLLTPLCCDDTHDVTPRVSALAGCDRLVSEPVLSRPMDYSISKDPEEEPIEEEPLEESKKEG